MRVDGRDRRGTLLCSSDVDQAQDAPMGYAPDDCQLAEVLVECDDRLVVIDSVRENREIARIARPHSH